MNRTTWKIATLVLIVAWVLLGHVEAQQDHKQHHPEGIQTSQKQMGEATPDVPAQAPMGQPMQVMMQQMQVMMQQMQGMMQQMHGQMSGSGMMGRGMMGDRDDDESSDDEDMMGRGMMMGGGGMMGRSMMMGRGGMIGHMQHQMARLTEQLNLSDEQQSKLQGLLRTYAKEGIRLKADIDTANLDLQQRLDTQPIDMDGVNTTLQIIAGKEAELRLVHIAAMQDIRKLLTPEQQKQFRTMWGHMPGSGGMMGHGGMQRGKSGN